MKITKDQKVLVLGASIAGLSTAWWLNHIGYQVTVVELAAAPRTNGAAVNLNPAGVALARRMCLYEKFQAYQLGVDRIEYKNADDVSEGSIVINDIFASDSENHPASSTTNYTMEASVANDSAGDNEAATVIHEKEDTEEIEIERDKFVKVMIDVMESQVQFLFSNSITAMEETQNSINVSFKTGDDRRFDLVFGCDGAHSGTRKLWFGPEQDYAHYLGAYFSISIVNKVLVPERTMQTFSVPCKTVSLNAYNGKTDIIFIYLSDEEINYDYRDIAAQRQMITDQFTGQGWRTGELLQEVDESDSFYFDKFTQIKMPAWSKGRVALIGDAAYCPSPAAGQGGSLALQGGAAIADALIKHAGNYNLAFADYERSLRPFIEEVQSTAEQNIKTYFVLKTEKEIYKRNTEAKVF
jgi:2-polyprenyl-6-methoxyphenol hydroxylase-like FAD-dependent oxidoreductase